MPFGRHTGCTGSVGSYTFLAIFAAMATTKKQKAKPVILITNDDGVTAPGIRNLVEAVKDLGTIIVVAPDKPQSGMGHAITIGYPLRLHPVQLFEGVDAWQCSGTPADCVKLAVDKVLHRKPDICLSGINHGANHSINVIYSGTMSAAIEASIENIPSIGFSLMNYSMEADFSACRTYARQLVQQVLAMKQKKKHLCLNVNIPNVDASLIKGLKVCRQAYAKYDEEFDERKDPAGRRYFWLTGEFKNFDKGKDTDVWALANNYVSVVPVQFDLTNHDLLQHLKTKMKA